MDFIFVLIELFSLGVTTEARRENTDWKSLFLKGGGSQFLSNFHVVADVSANHLCTDT